MAPFLFWTLALTVGGSAVMVVATQNIVRAAVWLLFTLVGTSALYFLLGADFVGATQLIVYVGGTLVLVVFGVMLTAQGPFVNLRTGAGEWAIGVVAGTLLFGVLAGTVALADWQTVPPEPEQASSSTDTRQLGQAFLGLEAATPDARLTGLPHPDAAPARRKVTYLLPFEVVSVHLLVVLIGAAYLARAKRRPGAAR